MNSPGVIGGVPPSQDILKILTGLPGLEPAADELISPPSFQRVLDTTSVNPEDFPDMGGVSPPAAQAHFTDKMFNDLKSASSPGLDGLARYGYTPPISDPYGSNLRSELKRILRRV
jgi:hypothetical protein